MCNCRLIACPLPCGKKAKAIVYSLSHDDPQQREHTSTLQMAQGTESPSNQLILGPPNQFTSQQSWERPTGPFQEMPCCQSQILPDTSILGILGNLCKGVGQRQQVTIWESKGDSTGISLMSIHHSYTYPHFSLRHFLCARYHQVRFPNLYLSSQLGNLTRYYLAA